MADQFCGQLWSSKNKGNIDVPSGRIRYGKSEKSDLSQARKADLDALADSLLRLPEDLRSKVTPSLLKLKTLMGQEQDAESWYNAVNEAENEFWAQAKEVSKQRVIKRYPKLDHTEVSKLTIEQRAAFVTSFWDIKNEITAAKYERHPNWLRVVQMFKQAKKDLLDEISKWNLPSELKKKLIAKVDKISLKLPSADPRVADNDPDLMNCATTENNAFYSDRHRHLTMCAGEFNSELTDATVYATLAHELGHSIDSDAIASDLFMETPAGRVVDRFCNAQGPVYSCAEWSHLKKSVLVEPHTVSEPTSPIRKLTSCLVSESGLNPFEYKAIRKVARQEAFNSMKSITSKNEFQLRLRPDRLRAVSEGYVFFQKYCDGDTSIYNELIAQELSCKVTFKEALKKVESIGTALNELKYSFCGRDCRDLTKEKLSRVTFEETADWVANKLTIAFIKRNSSLAARRESLFVSVAGFCASPDWVEVEDEHSSNRSRILSAFSPEVTLLVGCEPDKEIEKSRAKCDL
ncbi:MAG: hypothetical protein ACJ763_16770 [Bdellovibrionia bacterium]